MSLMYDRRQDSMDRPKGRLFFTVVVRRLSSTLHKNKDNRKGWIQVRIIIKITVIMNVTGPRLQNYTENGACVVGEQFSAMSCPWVASYQSHAVQCAEAGGEMGDHDLK